MYFKLLAFTIYSYNSFAVLVFNNKNARKLLKNSLPDISQHLKIS